MGEKFFRLVEMREKEIAVTSVFQKGKVTIPHWIRKKLGIHDGDKVIWIFKDGDYIMRKVGVKLESRMQQSRLLRKGDSHAGI